MDYYTIDFETANSNFTSACSIGIVGVTNGKKVLEKYYLINPEEPFNEFNIMIHHITESDVKNAPTFKDLWDKIKFVFTNTIVFSHNSLFDFSVLKAMLEKYEIEKPIFKFGCTVKIAKNLWKDEVPNHRLNTLASYLGVDLNHHQALSDASICVDIINRGMKMQNCDDIYEFYNALALRFGYMGPKNFYNTYQLKKRTKKELPKVKNDILFDQVIVISGKPKTITKNELYEKIISNGAYVDTIVNNRCNYFVMLDNYKEERLSQVHQLIKQGIEIKVINELELMALVK
jgi:DNA polymerase-3 subunit epsilon